MQTRTKDTLSNKALFHTLPPEQYIHINNNYPNNNGNKYYTPFTRAPLNTAYVFISLSDFFFFLSLSLSLSLSLYIYIY